MNIESDEHHDAALADLTAKGQLLEVISAQRPWGQQCEFKNAPPNLGAYFALMLQHAEKTFIVYQDERYTFQEVWERSNSLAGALQAVGIERGDRVAIAMRNYPEWVFAFIGTTIAGAIAVPLNAWWQGTELQEAIIDAGASLAMVDLQRHRRLEEVGATISQVVVRSAKAGISKIRYEDFANLGEATPRPVSLDPDDDATIFYTSGSTSYPKGAVSSHRALSNAMLNFAAYGMAQQTVDAKRRDASASDSDPIQPATLLTVPLFHVTGCHSIFMISVLIGRKIVMLDKWDPEDALAMIERERVTSFMGVPTMSRELTEHKNVSSYDLSSLAEINAGGAARPEAHLRRLEERHPAIRAGMAYGLTETNGTGAINNRQGYSLRPASTGRALKPLAELAILDEQGNPQQEGELGEVAVRAVTLAKGYWNRPKDTEKAFLSNGWFRTGDIGHLDSGYLTIVDRKKDMILRGGENIACQEVEAAMLADQQVCEACVFSIPDDRLGEAVCATIFVADRKQFDEKRLRQSLQSSLAAFKHPQTIILSNGPLPRLGSGKIDKQTIKTQYADNHRAHD
ncbi:MAG: class I adenylate-forming enzyme family protein [Pseudomonadota bacterium]